MKIPRQLLIGENIWAVRFVRKFGYGEQDKNLRGLCVPDKSEILISQGLTPRERLETLVHEILHAIEAEAEIDLSLIHI